MLVGSGVKGISGAIETPVSDRAAAGFALGLALGGKAPVLALDGTHALLAALEPLAEAARLGASLVVRVACGGEAGPLVDRAAVGAVLGLPGVGVAVASSAEMAEGLVASAQAAGGAHVVLVPRAVESGVADGSLAARVIRDGRRATVATWGSGLADVLAAELDDVAVIDLVTLAPLDLAALAASVRATGRLVIADPGDGVGQALVWPAAREAFDWLEAPPVVVAPEAVARAVDEALAY